MSFNSTVYLCLGVYTVEQVGMAHRRYCTFEVPYEEYDEDMFTLASRPHPSTTRCYIYIYIYVYIGSSAGNPTVEYPVSR